MYRAMTLVRVFDATMGVVERDEPGKDFLVMTASAALVAKGAEFGVVADPTSAVVSVRRGLVLATDLATPGWASTVVGVFMIVLVQLLAGTVIASLALLGARSRRRLIATSFCGLLIGTILFSVFWAARYYESERKVPTDLRRI